MRIAVVVSATMLPLLVWPALDAAAQQKAMSDEELIANAIAAAPEAIGAQAAVVTVDETGELKTLKQGTNNFTCFPDDPSNPANDPVCVDENGLEWTKAWIAKTEPPAGEIGFGYMLQGGSTPSNVEPHATEPPEGSDYMQEPPHVMIFNTGAAMQGYPDPGEHPDMSQPWVMWGGTPYEHLMLPVE